MLICFDCHRSGIKHYFTLFVYLSTDSMSQTEFQCKHLHSKGHYTISSETSRSKQNVLERYD